MRRYSRASFCLGLVVIAACGGEAVVQTGGDDPPHETTSASATIAPPAPSAKKDETKVVTVDADTPMATASGATYIVPKAWTATTKNGVVLLEDPDHDISLTFIERKEQDGDAAIAAAWRQVKPDFARTIRLTTPRPGRDGWDASVDVDYETTEAESRWVWANAARKGDTWYVTLGDGTKNAWDRRGAQADIAAGSYRAKGVVEESFKGKIANVLDAPRLSKLEAFLEQSRQAAQIPGFAVAIVQNGKIVFEKGFGVKELGKKDPITPNTMFRIASMTKPLTSLMIAALVDEKQFMWDTNVTKLWPTFAVGDAELTKKLTMRNMLCACTGIPYDNLGAKFEWIGLSAEKMLERMKEVRPTTGFGETFQYSNAMIASAGFMAAHAADPKKPMAEAYVHVMQNKIFGPLGMRNTTFDPKVVARSDHASPHNRNAKFEVELSRTDWSAWMSSLNPGGGAWSTVHDLAQVLLLELAKGKNADGKQVVSELNLLARREPQARAGEKVSYGLALGISTLKGVSIYSHGGVIAGYASEMFFLPDHGVGAVFLSNLGIPPPPIGFASKLFELLFDGRDEAKEDAAIARTSQEADFIKEMSKIDFAPERAFFEKFVGTYAHPLYGKLTIRIDAKKGGVLDAGEWTSGLGREREEDGTEKLVATTTPWMGWPDFVPKEQDGKMTLELRDEQRMVIFERVKGGK